MKLVESLFLRTNHAPASGHLFFRFFQKFSKEKQFFRIANIYFSISFIRLVQTDFLLSGKSIFLVRAILLLVETIIGIRCKQSKKELILASGQVSFWLVKTIFSLYFSENLASFFPSSENVFFNEILQWERKKETSWLVQTHFLRVETHFFCSEVFPSSGNTY